MSTQQGHGEWLYACGHSAYRCKCPEHIADKPHYLSDLCVVCRAKLILPEPEPSPPDSVRQPFPKATD